MLQEKNEDGRIQPMVVRQEGDFYPVPQEQVPQGNSFLAFIGRHQEALVSLSRFTRDLKNEEQGWRRSASIEELINEYWGIVSLAYPGMSSRVVRRMENETNRKIRDLIFGNRREGLEEWRRQQELTRDQVRKNLGSEHGKKVDAWLGRLEAMSTDYHETIKPVVASIGLVKEELLTAFGQFLKSDYQGLFDFESFLSSPKHRSQREDIRPFLTFLIEDDSRVRREVARERKDSLLDQARTTWRNKAREGLIEEVLLRWIRHVLGSQRREDRSLAGWLRLFPKTLASINGDTQGADDEESIIRVVKTLAEWPQQLRTSYENFVDNETYQVVASIRRGLEQFKTKDSLPSLGLPLGERLGNPNAILLSEKVAMIMRRKTNL